MPFTLQLGEGIAGWVAQTRRPVVMDGRPLPAELAGRLAQPHLRSSIVVPIASAGAPVAVLSVSSTRTTLGDKELRWLAAHINQTVLRTTERQETPGPAARIA